MSSVPQDPAPGKKRRGIGPKLRFEVFRRDGFKCRYCGAIPTKAPLVIDHVIPVAEGGGNSPSNLVTSCFDCNSGKSDRLLTASPLPAQDAKMLREQARQIAEYRRASEALEKERVEYWDKIFTKWWWTIGRMSPQMAARLPSLAQEWPWEDICYAIDATAVKLRTADPHAENAERMRGQTMYFYGVLRRLKASRETP